MSIVLAALDTGAAALPVLETARRMGELTACDVEAVHVRHGEPGAAETLGALALRAGVALHVLEGPVVPTLLAAAGAPEVAAVVVGARATPGGQPTVGRTTVQVLEGADRPVVVVPPEAIAPGPLARLLLPLEGSEASSRPVLEGLWPLLAADVEVTVLHVFTEATRPAMLDHPARDLDILGCEFLRRHFPHAARIEFRPGPVSAAVAEVARSHRADLVVLSWSQDSSPGRAQVVREVLGASARPVLLLAVGGPSTRR